MCVFFSCIVTREGQVYHEAQTNDEHDYIIRMHGLRDDESDRNLIEFCRVEILPPHGNVFAPVEEWAFTIDERILPDWWDGGYEVFAIDALREFVSERIVTSGRHEFSEGRVWAGGSASVEASGSASVEASGSASVRAWGSASVVASDSASVEASDSASVRARGSASVVASDSASVTAWGSASVVASDSAPVEAYDSASVEAHDSASVVASDSASVEASDSASVKAYDSASVELSDNAICRKNGILYVAKNSTLRARRALRVK